MKNNLPKAAMDALKFEEKVLPNGLVIRLLSMPEYGAVHAIYTTKFGSINRVFTQNGVQHTLPAGVAHFLEHKMFENEDGVDAFTLYAETGASANAYTSFDRTSYIFTATDKLERNLDILLSFVGHPHFTKETIEKEQGIIGQEIKMYEDYAELRCMFAVLECLYHQHPVRDEIVGTVESIAEITPEMLYSCCDAYYNPSNMALCVAGNIDMDTLVAAVERANLPQEMAPATTSSMPDEPDDIFEKERVLEMSIAMPTFGIGFKETPPEGSTLKTEILCDLLTELICGETSSLYRKLYDEGLVQPGFGGDFGCNEGCLYFMFSGESDDPDRVREELLKEIERQRSEGIEESQFETCKRMMYGEAIADLESVERVASLLSSSYFHGRTPAEELAAVASVTKEDVEDALARFLDVKRSAYVVVNPAG